MLENVLLILYKNNHKDGGCKTKDFDPTSRYFALLTLYIQKNRAKICTTIPIFRDNRILK